MVRSPEIEAVVRRFYKYLGNGDFESITNLLTASEESVFLGSDLEEWWVGSRQMQAVMFAQLAEVGRFAFTLERVVGYECGDMAWAADQTVLDIPGSEPSPMRGSFVFHLEAGQWRVVHFHLSAPITNEDLLGVRLTTTLDELALQAMGAADEVAAVAAVDGTITIVFTDIEASTEMAERMGDRRWLELLKWHEGVVAGSADSRRGRIVKSQGDGFMLAFPSASGALDFALDVQGATSEGYQDQPVRMRVGVNAGEALVDRDDFFGHTVIVASRVAAHARGGETLATDLVAGLVSGSDRFNFGPRRDVELKGLSGTYAVRALASASAR